MERKTYLQVYFKKLIQKCVSTRKPQTVKTKAKLHDKPDGENRAMNRTTKNNQEDRNNKDLTMTETTKEHKYCDELMSK